MKIENLITDNDAFSDEDYFSLNTSTPLRRNRIEFVGQFKKIDKNLKFLDYIKLDTNFNE